jgi:hypothetical protein
MLKVHVLPLQKSAEPSPAVTVQFELLEQFT